MINVLMVSGLIFLTSILIMGICGFNTIIFMTTFTVFILITFLNMIQIYKKNNTTITEKIDSFDIGIKAFKEKKYLKAIVYIVSYPMCIVGIALVIINMIYVWIMMLA